MSLIKISNGYLGYNGKIVISNINITVNKGDYLCILGENGSGKSTIMKTILGLIPPVKGKILFGDGLLPNEIGYLPQQTDVQRDFPASVKEVVLSGLLNRQSLLPFYTKSEKDKANLNMDRLGVLNISKKCYRELSGGQQQRVLLARALCATKKILLLDEPVTGLDPKASKDLYDLIYDLNHKDNITIVMISHDIDASNKFASNVINLNKKMRNNFE